MKEVKLPGRFRQPLAPRSEEHPLQREVFFLEACVGTLELFGRGAGLFELAFHVVESLLHVVELFEHGTEPLLAGGQVIRDGVELLRHNHIYDYDGACVGEFLNIFRERLSWRGRSVCGAAQLSRRCH